METSCIYLERSVWTLPGWHPYSGADCFRRTRWSVPLVWHYGTVRVWSGVVFCYSVIRKRSTSLLRAEIIRRYLDMALRLGKCLMYHRIALIEGPRSVSALMLCWWCGQRGPMDSKDTCCHHHNMQIWHANLNCSSSAVLRVWKGCSEVVVIE